MSSADHPIPHVPAKRSSAQEMKRHASYFSDEGITRHLLDAIPTILLILNRNRQIVYGNRILYDFLGLSEKNLIYGMRPGELLTCIHAGREPGGCGTAEPCSVCGMLAAILAGLSGRREVRECRFLRQNQGRSEATDLLVWATPLTFQGETFSIFALSDISHEKRRRALERIFFHDVLNIVGSIKGFADLLCERDPADRPDIYTAIQAAADQTIEEIEAQRILLAAESRELVARPGPLVIATFLRQSADIYRHHAVARERLVHVEEPLPEGILVSDQMLLTRILGNMLKNALEAAESGETVRLGGRIIGDKAEFRVHNRAVIPAAVQLEIFQRSFSTRGGGRGLGTYSMKLLSEFLGGEVSFTSREPSGTTFRLSLPLIPPAD